MIRFYLFEKAIYPHNASLLSFSSGYSDLPMAKPPKETN